MNKLTKSEQKEPMMVTWGRIITICRGLGRDNPARLEALAEKFNIDLKEAKIEQKYFAKGGEFERMCKEQI